MVARERVEGRDRLLDGFNNFRATLSWGIGT